jgi:hypothetical protein
MADYVHAVLTRGVVSLDLGTPGVDLRHELAEIVEHPFRAVVNAPVRKARRDVPDKVGGH